MPLLTNQQLFRYRALIIYDIGMMSKVCACRRVRW